MVVLVAVVVALFLLVCLPMQLINLKMASFFFYFLSSIMYKKCYETLFICKGEGENEPNLIPHAL